MLVRLLHWIVLEGFTKQLEAFVNSYPEKHGQYKQGLIEANEAYSHENLIKAILA